VKIMWRPFGKALHFVFHPLAQLWRAMMRVTKRLWAKVRNKKQNEDETENEVEHERESFDEEAAPVTASPLTPAKPMPLTIVPPITLTAPIERPQSAATMYDTHTQ